MINEWENEPDYLRFTEDTTGWECIIKRTKALGILCGYVVIPKDSILYNKHYTDELFNNIKVHGGLTFSDYEETDDEYLIGFDCAHLDDLAPYKQDLYQGTYRNIAYVEYECLRLARQLYELSNTYTKSNTGGKNMRDISELTDCEKLDLEYYNNQAKTKKFISRRALRIFEHFQNNPFSMQIKIGEIGYIGTIDNREPFKLNVRVEINNHVSKEK